MGRIAEAAIGAEGRGGVLVIIGMEGFGESTVSCFYKY